MLTEEQAREKWCPFARYAFPERGFQSINRWINEGDTQMKPDAACCIASDCMAWRVGIYSEHDVDTGEQVSPDKGYCGLAGRPE